MAGSKKPVRKSAKRSAAKASAANGSRKAAPKRSARAGKAEGDAPVLAYIARLPAEQKAIAAKLDAIVAQNAPGVLRALKWNVPFYGMEGRGWFCAMAAFTHHTSLNFMRGAELEPEPPVRGVKENRRVAYRTLAEVDEAQVASWVRQAAALPGWFAPAAPDAKRAPDVRRRTTRMDKKSP